MASICKLVFTYKSRRCSSGLLFTKTCVVIGAKNSNECDSCCSTTTRFAPPCEHVGCNSGSIRCSPCVVYVIVRIPISPCFVIRGSYKLENDEKYNHRCHSKMGIKTTFDTILHLLIQNTSNSIVVPKDSACL